jgi:GTP-binding protein EngB required for normal cell division
VEILMASDNKKSLRADLLTAMSDVQRRLGERMDVDIPLPQFIVVGKQSVGKSRLLEALAGERFNFVSGTLGSRRPTVLEFRRCDRKSVPQSVWSVYEGGVYVQYSVERVMEIVSSAHEKLGKNVATEAVRLRLDSPDCVDMLVTDLPGFREFSLDAETQVLADKISDLVEKFIKDKKNIMLCVEEAGDSATLSILAKCRKFDANSARTILVRNKLDKYYKDLDNTDVSDYLISGLGDLPVTLPKFALSLPHWNREAPEISDFGELVRQCEARDMRELRSRGASEEALALVGVGNFSRFLEQKTEEIFMSALEPCMQAVKVAEARVLSEISSLEKELKITDPVEMHATMKSAAQCFARALIHVMEGSVIGNFSGNFTLEDELHEFHEWAITQGYHEDFELLPSEQFSDLNEYLEFLDEECGVSGFEVRLSGGAQYTRLKQEVEIYFRFSDVMMEVDRRDVIQARGISIGQISWQDVVLKLLTKEGQPQVRRKVSYVAARLQWFFCVQKEAVLCFMENIQNSADEHLYSRLFTDRVQFIRQNEAARNLIFSVYDEYILKQKKLFTDLFNNTLISTFQNPWALIKGSSWVPPSDDNGDDSTDAFQDMYLPSFEDTKARIPQEIAQRSSVENYLRKLVNEIPTDVSQVDVAVTRVQMLMVAVFNNIRNLVCEQLELFADSFFLLPMLRHLETVMNTEISFSTSSTHDQISMQIRRDQLQQITAQNKLKLEELKIVENNLARLLY